MKLTFLGANRQVTGSRYALEVGGLRVMIDCGLFQEREFQSRNWDVSRIAPEAFDALFLTHAHIDHSGLIPRFIQQGFAGTVYATHPTVELAEVMLCDSAEIQMEDAAYKRRRHKREGRQGKHPEVPLYDLNDAQHALRSFRGVNYREPLAIDDRLEVTFHDAGHILGSAMLEIVARENGQTRRIIFSGDLGQWNRPLVHDPTLLTRADYVVMESTYGNRDHEAAGDVETLLQRVISETAAAGGNVVIPTFAVERVQELMYHISRLVHANRIPDIPVFVDSPMAVDVTDIFLSNESWLDDDTRQLLHSKQPPLRFPGLHMVRSQDASMDINSVSGPCIIMSTSGMCTSGRIKHHLRHNISDSNNTILFIGYQGRGTLGRRILDGDPEVRIHGRNYRVAARIEKINGLSAHADRTDLIQWIEAIQPPPRQIFLTHGEEEASLALADQLRHSSQIQAAVPEYGETVELD